MLLILKDIVGSFRFSPSTPSWPRARRLSRSITILLTRSQGYLEHGVRWQRKGRAPTAQGALAPSRGAPALKPSRCALDPLAELDLRLPTEFDARLVDGQNDVVHFAGPFGRVGGLEGWNTEGLADGDEDAVVGGADAGGDIEDFAVAGGERPEV